MSRPRGRGGRFQAKPFGGGNFGEQSSTGVSDQLLKNARKSGQLNLSSRGLTEVPDKVWRVNLDAAAESREAGSFESDERWWDQVELNKLILASNKLQTVSENVKLLSALNNLDLHDNEISSLPSALGELEQLQKLNLSHNKLTNLPAELFSCPMLVFLHLEHNCLTELPEEIGRLTHIDNLDLSNNKLTSVPDSIGELTKLISLNISHNSLSTLPASVQHMKAMKVLDLTHNQITQLPSELGYMRSLEQLYIRHNKLKELPLLENCANLKELHLGNNLLTVFDSAQLKCLTSLSVLDVRDNKISVVPEEIITLISLERLDITNNDVSTLPFEMGNMPNLKSLIVDGNPMRGIRRDIIARGSEGIKKYLRSRVEEPADSPSNKPTPAVQKAGTSGQSGLFGGGDQIDAHSVKLSKALDYSGKKSEEIPGDVWELGVQTQVTDVNFSKNALKQWPSNMVLFCDWATNINLGFNKMSTLHSDLGLFLQLKDLDLRNNSLSVLPAEMEALQSLHTLTLSFNRFGVIPDVVYKLKSLETLLIANNQVAQLDAVRFQGLAKLASLDLQNNNLGSIPAELGDCTSLRSLLLSGNPTRNPRPAILNKGTLAILEYLRDRIVR